MALKPGLSASIIPALARAASKRGSVSYASRVGGGTDWLASQPSNDRFSGSQDSNWLNAVVPVRDSPTMTIGARITSVARSGCRLCQSVTRRRFLRLPRSCPSSTPNPSAVRPACVVPDA